MEWRGGGDSQSIAGSRSRRRASERARERRREGEGKRGRGRENVKRCSKLADKNREMGKERRRSLRGGKKRMMITIFVFLSTSFFLFLTLRARDIILII